MVERYSAMQFVDNDVSSVEAVVAELASARLSERDFNVCFDFPLIRVAIALNTRKTEHWQWQGGGGVEGAPSASIDSSLVGTEGTTLPFM